MVELKKVTLSLPGPAGPVNVLKEIDMHMDRGETVSVVGPSGAGKTTLIMVTAGLERADSGRVYIQGNDLSTMSEDQAARFRRGRIGIVFQGFHLAPAMTALENVALPLEFAGDENPREKALEALEAVGLKDRAGHYPAQLSGGEQQRTAVARAFAPRPALILADEPTGNLDAETGNKVMDMLFDHAADMGTGLVLITHDTTLAKRCSRTVRMKDGRVEGD